MWLTHTPPRRGDDEEGKGPFRLLDTSHIDASRMPDSLHEREGASSASQGVQQHRHTREALLICRARAPQEVRELHQAPHRDVHQACPHADVHPEHRGGPTCTDVVEDRRHLRQGERFDVQPEEHEEGGQDTRTADGQLMAPGPLLDREHIHQQKSTQSHHKGQVDQKEPSANDADDAVHAMHVGFREERIGNQDRHGGAIRRDRGWRVEASADQKDDRT